jgi:hypothetical protein
MGHFAPTVRGSAGCRIYATRQTFGAIRSKQHFALPVSCQLHEGRKHGLENSAAAASKRNCVHRRNEGGYTTNMISAPSFTAGKRTYKAPSATYSEPECPPTGPSWPKVAGSQVYPWLCRPVADPSLVCLRSSTGFMGCAGACRGRSCQTGGTERPARRHGRRACADLRRGSPRGCCHQVLHECAVIAARASSECRVLCLHRR